MNLILEAIKALFRKVENSISANVAALSKKITTPSTAAVGQTLVVKAVDENGVPTEWGAVDPWIIQSVTPGSAKKFKITVDDSGTLTATEVT